MTTQEEIRAYGCLPGELEEARLAGSNASNWRWAVQVWSSESWHTLSHRYPVESTAKKELANEISEGMPAARLRVIKLAE